jgi:hypothetical protein
MSNLAIIETIELSTRVSTWTEHLCLHRTSDGSWCLDIRSYEMVGEYWELSDDDGELPERINGREVIGDEDGYVVINNLVLHSGDYPIYVFETLSMDEFRSNLDGEHIRFCTKDTAKKVQTIIGQQDQ